MLNFEWTIEFIVALAIIFIIAAITIPAGIGGGILFVPVLRLVAGFSQREATALSQVLITGASLGCIVFQIMWQLHNKSEPLLAQPYFVVIMMPALLSGSIVGVYMNKILPDIVSLLVLVCLCASSSVLIFKKGFTIYHRENEELATLVETASASHTPLELLIEDSIDAPPQSFMYDERLSSISSSVRRRVRDTSQSPEQLVNILKPDLKKSNIILSTLTRSSGSFLTFTLSYWILLILFMLLRGSKANSSIAQIVPCSLTYWLLTGGQLLLGIAVAFTVASSEWKLILLTFLTGFISTISGGGGGVLLNPLLLARNLDPQQASATSTIIMFVMASCSALEFVMAGKVQPVLTSTMAITFLGSVIGMTVITWLVKKLGRQSILVFILGAIIVIGCALLIYLGVYDTMSTIQKEMSPFQLGILC